MDRIDPHPSRPTPPETQALMGELGVSFGMPLVEGRPALVRYVGWSTRDNAVERRYWANCERPAARFYVEQNPWYPDGYGLLTLIPLDLRAFATSSARLLNKMLRLRVESTRAVFQRWGLAPRLQPAQIGAMLGQSEFFAGVEPALLERMAEQIDRMDLTPGRIVFRQGDHGDAIYLVLRGVLYVMLDTEARPLVVNKLSRGSVFGETSLLTGAARSATVRSATSATLLRIPHGMVEALITAAPSFGVRLWRDAARHRLSDLLSPLEGEETSARAWIDRHPQRDLAAGQTLSVEGWPVVYLIDGEVLREGSRWSLVTGPALLPGGGDLRALRSARLVRLDVPDSVRATLGLDGPAR